LFSFTPQLLYAWVKNFPYAWSRRLGGLLSKTYILEKRNSCSYQDSNPQSIQPLA